MIRAHATSPAPADVHLHDTREGGASFDFNGERSLIAPTPAG